MSSRVAHSPMFSSEQMDRAIAPTEDRCVVSVRSPTKKAMIPGKLLTLFLLIGTINTTCTAPLAYPPWSISIHEPLNNSFVLAKSTRISMNIHGIDIHPPDFPLQTCLRLLSSYFDPINMGCFDPTQIADLRLSKIPYGKHQVSCSTYNNQYREGQN